MYLSGQVASDEKGINDGGMIADKYHRAILGNVFQPSMFHVIREDKTGLDDVQDY
jgi:hypothetical protein